jgi:hypothetical protein
MPRYFFHLTGGDNLRLTDEVGEEFDREELTPHQRQEALQHQAAVRRAANAPRIVASSSAGQREGTLWQWPGNYRTTNYRTPSLGFASQW